MVIRLIFYQTEQCAIWRFFAIFIGSGYPKLGSVNISISAVIATAACTVFLVESFLLIEFRRAKGLEILGLDRKSVV